MIFLDENLPQRAAGMLTAFDESHPVRSVLEVLPAGASDTEVFTALGRLDRKVVLVTQDSRILRHPTERTALRESRISVVFLGAVWIRRSWHEKAWQLIRVWPGVTRAIDGVSAPTAFELGGKPAKIRRLCYTSEL